MEGAEFTNRRRLRAATLAAVREEIGRKLGRTLTPGDERALVDYVGSAAGHFPEIDLSVAGARVEDVVRLESKAIAEARRRARRRRAT